MSTDPTIHDIGLGGLLVRFADRLSEPANRAALALRAELRARDWDGVQETSTALTSVYLRFDPLIGDHDDLKQRLQSLLDSRDWTQEPLPEGRRHWRIPCVLGGEHGPQFDDAVQAAGLDAEDARAQIADATLRVLTLGFAPGQPYLGELPEAWNIPRLSELNKQVPGGALVLAIRQLIVFTRPAPTGWRHIGQTAFQCYRPKADDPFPLRPGDRVGFRPVPPEEMDEIREADTTGDGGATAEPI